MGNLWQEAKILLAVRQNLTCGTIDEVREAGQFHIPLYQTLLSTIVAMEFLLRDFRSEIKSSFLLFFLV